nr:pyruvate kinase [Trypanoplasma borreli]
MRKSQLQFNTELRVHHPPALFRSNKIICTIGPSSQSVEVLKDLMKAGLNVARMNFSHGTYEYHQKTIDNVRKAASELGIHVGIALDTKGPEIRTGLFPAGDVVIEAHKTVILTTDETFKEKGTAEKFYVDYMNITKVVPVGGHIFVDDGLLDLIVVKISGKDIECVAQNTHTISNRKGINLPNADVDLPAVSEKDLMDLQFGAKNRVDFVFASFIRNADQVNEVRQAFGGKIAVIAKIENYQGIDNIDAIIDAADGIMVARGDLGVEIPAEKVVIAQKMIMSKCNKVGKTVICATQMLDSMTHGPRPTRAEVSDVAKSVLDGADCVMLSGETAKGKYPVETVVYMSRICCETQVTMWNMAAFEAIKNLQSFPLIPEEAICSSAVNSIFELHAKAILVLTNTGRSAHMVSKYRPPVPIICASQELDVCRLLSITRGTIPVYYDTEKLGPDYDREKRVGLAIDVGKQMGVFKEGDVVVAVHADHHTKGFANQIRAIYIK